MKAVLWCLIVGLSIVALIIASGVYDPDYQLILTTTRKGAVSYEYENGKWNTIYINYESDDLAREFGDGVN